LQVDDELEFSRLLDRQFARLGTLEDFVDVAGGAPHQIGETGRIGHQAADLHILSQRIDCR
jgi:hypothetical protein